MPATAFLTRENLEAAFRALGAKARAAEKLVEIAIYGGSALVLTLPGRAATKDVDAVMQHDSAWLRGAVSELAAEKGWPADWLNDGVKGWLSHRDADPEAKRLFRTYPSEEEPGLRVLVASPQYLFAMKCLAMRIGGADQAQDRSDIEIRPSGMTVVDPWTVPRPQSLSDVAARTLGGEPFDPLLREFLDTFYGLPDAERMTTALASAPASIGPVQDAYLAAVAEHLALRFDLAAPQWSEEPGRFLTKPFFAGGLESLKATLLVESPLAFRRRQIFVTANALSRASEHATR